MAAITRSITIMAAFLALALGAAASATGATDDPAGLNDGAIDVRLMGADLIDELVYAWKEKPPFPASKGVALAELIAPTGLDERFATLVENRLYEFLRENPEIPISLIHCSVCTQPVVKSDPQKTVISRGIDQPEVLEGILKINPDRLALSLAFEAEGRELLLRAHIFELRDQQRIVWAKTFSTSTSARRILRDTAPLVSLETARAQQNALLLGREPMELATRFSLRMFSPKSADAEIEPLAFIEQSFAALPGVNRNMRVEFTVGFTSIQDSLSGWSIGGHVSRLLFRKTPHLTQPDLYWFIGWHQVRLRGPGALPFGERQLDMGKITGQSTEPKATIVAWRLGFETHVKYRYGAFAFMEYIPLLKKSDVIAEKQLLGVPYHDLGLGMVVRW